MSKQLKLPTLLVVADNPSIRFWVKKHLDEQFFILQAENKQEALEALNARLDFIIVDAALESSDALELCKELSQLTQKNLVPIFLVTGRLKKSFRDKAIECGVTEFLSDQLDLEELEQLIAEGKKAASLRQKTEEVGLSIKLPKLTTTPLKNKVIATTPASRLLAQAKKEKRPVSLLLLRIDGFKKMQNPEEILKSFSAFINDLLREKDLLIPSQEGRFILLFYNTLPQAARTIAEKLREKIHKMQNLTVTIAVPAQETNEKNFDKMIESATHSLKTDLETNSLIFLNLEAE